MGTGAGAHSPEDGAVAATAAPGVAGEEEGQWWGGGRRGRWAQGSCACAISELVQMFQIAERDENETFY